MNTKQQIIESLKTSHDMIIENANECRVSSSMNDDDIRDMFNDAHVVTCIIALIETIHDDVVVNVIDNARDDMMCDESNDDA